MPPKIMYCIGSYRGGPELYRLVHALLDGNDPDTAVVVHHDSSRSTPPYGLADDPRVEVLTHTPGVRWGTPDFMRMLLRTLRWSLENREFDWCYWITEQDF